MIKIDDMESFTEGVIEAYHNAAEADWFSPDYTCLDIALDMIAFDGTLEEYIFDPILDEDEDELVNILIPILRKVHWNE